MPKFDLEATLQWGRFIMDNTALESNDKHQIKQHLQSYLEKLNLRYFEERLHQFPNHDEYNKLSALCRSLAKLLGKSKSEFGQGYSEIKLIENRFPKLKISRFLYDILDRFEKLPASPRTTIWNARKACETIDPKRGELLSQVYGVLSSQEWRPSFDVHPWAEWLDVLWSLKLGTEVAILGATQKSLLQRSALGAVYRDHKNVMAYFVFMDLIRQQHLWMRLYERTTRPTITYFTGLQRPGDMQRLLKVVHGDVMSPEAVKAMTSQGKRRERSRRYYRASASRRWRSDKLTRLCSAKLTHPVTA